MDGKADKIGNVFAFIKIIGHQFFYKWSDPTKRLILKKKDYYVLKKAKILKNNIYKTTIVYKNLM